LPDADDEADDEVVLLELIYYFLLNSEDANSPTPKSILNGTVITRAAGKVDPIDDDDDILAINNRLPSCIDKSIVLGPTKTNFASSLHSGLKNETTLRKPQTRYGNRQVKTTKCLISLTS
jgi:hypothetical protein